ncbi:MAG: shikimate dehydrogenase [Candidatus Glassbacteria bacterium]|nr:shikimate dehydrogenase [Candidatus Glassbacteria bacterium]
MNRGPISGVTRVLGVIGDPVEHSLSPLLHNFVLDKLNLDYRYLPFHVRADQAGSVGEAMRTLGLAGLNVTIPHKETLYGQVEVLSDEADAVGAVNTVGWDDTGRLAGHNTDVAGFEKSLEIRGLLSRLEGANTVVLGAGGAARAVLYAMARNGVSRVSIVNRTQSRAEDLAGWFSYRFPSITLEVVPVGETRDLANTLADTSVTVNVTPRGMAPRVGESPLPDGVLPPEGSVVYDTIYTPARTRLLECAEQAGCETVNGLDMLIIQGMESLEWWLGRKVGWQGMLDELRRLLNESLNQQ